MQRSAFLARVAERLAGVESVPLPDTFPATPVSGDGRLFDRFAEELQRAGGAARRITIERLPAAILELAAAARTAVLADDIDPFRQGVLEGLAGAGCEVVPATRQAAAAADLGVTSAVAGVASTGSVFVVAGPASPRLASLLPPAHVVVLPERLLLPGFEELLPVVSGHMVDAGGGVGAAAAVLITGPSRTSDIELTLVRGVHGPRQVTVLVLAE